MTGPLISMAAAIIVATLLGVDILYALIIGMVCFAVGFIDGIIHAWLTWRSAHPRDDDG